jgi:hypothetical protein
LQISRLASVRTNAIRSHIDMRLVFRLLAVIVLTLFQSACCGCGSDWLPPDRDDEGAKAEARKYVEAHRSQLRTASDAGTSSSECVSGLGALAADVAVAVVSRGHAGGDSAAEVEINPGACFQKIVVLVVLTGGVWHGVRAVAYDATGREVTSVGDDKTYMLSETVSASGDLDLGSDELF